MRNKIAAGNWKMNLTFDEAIALTNSISTNIKDKLPDNRHVILSPPFVYLHKIIEAIKTNKQLHVAAQNCSHELSGAFTGEVSAAMLQSIGVEYVIIGHSERRNLFNENHEILRKKVDLVLEHNMQPIFCCGEKMEQRNSLRHHKIIELQLWESLFHLDDEQLRKCVIAYEPVWAIGTGLTATPAQAQEMHLFIRNMIAEKYSPETSQAISLLYGGSCNEKNAKELFALPDVDGGLIGGASLKADSFTQIINSF